MKTNIVDGYVFIKKNFRSSELSLPRTNAKMINGNIWSVIDSFYHSDYGQCN